MPKMMLAAIAAHVTEGAAAPPLQARAPALELEPLAAASAGGALAGTAGQALPVGPVAMRPFDGSGGFGAEVLGVDLSQPLLPDHFQAIAAAFERHSVLVFRGQDRMGADGQLRLIQALNRCWGLEARSEQQRIALQSRKRYMAASLATLPKAGR